MRSPAAILGPASLCLVRGAIYGLVFLFLVLVSAALVLIPAVLAMLVMGWERLKRVSTRRSAVGFLKR